MTENMSSKLQTVLSKSTTQFNLGAAQLVQAAVRRGEGRLASTGALSTTTGKYTGRSPHDKL